MAADGKAVTMGDGAAMVTMAMMTQKTAAAAATKTKTADGVGGIATTG